MMVLTRGCATSDVKEKWKAQSGEHSAWVIYLFTARYSTCDPAFHRSRWIYLQRPSYLDG